MSGPFTLVSFHAHPDDEALLTGGTLARVAAEGHRVVLVVATLGEAGLAEGSGAALGGVRRRELEESARLLGVDRLVVLDHPDSGWSDTAGATSRTSGPVFSELDPEQVGAEVAAVLREEGAHVLTIYDPSGGYGHPDHVQVHRAGVAAAALAGTPVVLEATIDRRLFAGLVRVLRAASRVLPVPTLPERLDTAYTDAALITHQVDVRPHWAAKRAALVVHHSQSTGGVRTLGLIARVPLPVLRRVWGSEWFRHHDVSALVCPPCSPRARHDDVFAALRD